MLGDKIDLKELARKVEDQERLLREVNLLTLERRIASRAALEQEMDPQLPPGRIDSGNLADGAVTRRTIANGAVGPDQIENGTISAAKLATGVLTTGWTAVSAFTGTWVNFGGGTYYDAAYMRDGAGVVHLRGRVKSGTIGTSAFTLPVGYRPAKESSFPVVSNSLFGEVLVPSGGTVVPNVGSNVWVSLDGISFPTT